jgi:RNA polymerase sigma factor (sigma-70 family)
MADDERQDGEGQVYEFPDRRPGPARPQGDEADLFLSFHPKLVGVVRSMINTSPEIIDDACAFAWAQFLRYQPDRERGWRGWLTTTAAREALKLHRQEAKHVATTYQERESDPGYWVAPPDPRDNQADRLALREAFELLAKVPERRRQAKALHVIGLSYAEIGELLGINFTNVNRLITEANAIIREEHARQAPEHEPRSARAIRLRELEESQARWLVAAIGRPPGKKATAQSVLAWRRAALAIDDYRREHGPGLQDEPLGDRPSGGPAARAYDLAVAAVKRLQRVREPGRALDSSDRPGASSADPPSIER